MVAALLLLCSGCGSSTADFTRGSDGVLPIGASGSIAQLRCGSQKAGRRIPGVSKNGPLDISPCASSVSIPTGVMISYSHANTAFALELEKSLVEAGFTVWIDTKITPGKDWRSNIAEAIELSFAVVVVLSPTSVASKYCKVS